MSPINQLTNLTLSLSNNFSSKNTQNGALRSASSPRRTWSFKKFVDGTIIKRIYIYTFFIIVSTTTHPKHDNTNGYEHFVEVILGIFLKLLKYKLVSDCCRSNESMLNLIMFQQTLSF